MDGIINIDAFDVHRLAHVLGQAYYSYLSIITIAEDTKANDLMPNIPPGQIVPVGFVENKDGETHHTYNFEYYLDQTRSNPFVKQQIEMVWPMGALLTLGDALKAYKYFDHNPILELIYHLRNGIAHNNKFEVNCKRLKQFPAHNKFVQNVPALILEITPELEGQSVLFDFLAPGDIITLFTHVSAHLSKLAHGQP